MSTSSSDSTNTTSYTDGNSNIGSLFASPSDIISWNNFGTYVADLSLNEDPTARANAEIFTLTVDENLVVNGNTTINGTLNSISSTELQTLDGIETNIQDTINTFQDTIDSLEEQSLRIQNPNTFTVNGQNATFNSGISIIGIKDYITSGGLGISQELPKPIIITAGDGIDISDNGTISISEPFTISNGNVGIGTDSPSEKLVVNGDTTLNGIIGMPNNVKIESKEYFGNSVTTPSYAWDFRNNTGTNDILDIVNGKIATLHGSAYSTYDGMVFDGSDDYIELDPWEFGGEAFSFETYLKIESFDNDTSVYFRIFQFVDESDDYTGDNDANKVLFGNITNTTISQFKTSNTTNATWSTIRQEDFFPSQRIWIHIIGTVDNNGIMRLYKNGMLNGFIHGVLPRFSKGTKHYIGRDKVVETRYFYGTMAYFRWWDGTALSADEVETLYANRENIDNESLNFNIDNERALTISKGKISMPNNVDIESKKPFGNSLFGNSVTTTVTTPSYAWDFRNNTGTSDVPDIINGKIATLYGAYSTYDGMVFDGSDSYIQLDSWETGGQAFSVEALVKYDSFNNWSRIFDFGDGQSNDNIVLTNNSTTTELEFQVYKDADIIIGGGMGELDETTGTKWQHIVATVDQDNTARVYIDGTLDASGSGSEANAVLTRTNHYIGKSAWSSNAYFHGTIAYFRWWDGTALSADEVAVLSSSRESSLKESLNFNIDNERTLTINKGSVELIGSPSYPILNLHTTSEGAVLQKWTYVRDDGAIRPMKLLSRGDHYIQGHLISSTGFIFQTPDHFDFYTDVTNVCTMRSNGDFIVRKSATIEGVLYLQGGTVDENSLNVIEQDRTNTYIKFGVAGTTNDWAYLRQIGSKDEIMLALDFHDGAGDAGFVIRDMNSTAADEDTGDYETNVRFKVDRGGNVGIGTDSPNSKLQIVGSIGARVLQMSYIDNSGDTRSLVIKNPDDGSQGGSPFIIETGNSLIGSVDGHNNFFCGSDNGEFTVINFNNQSDDRIKSNEIPITNALESIMKLKPYTYDKYDNMEKTGSSYKESGLISQDIWYYVPELRHLINLGKYYEEDETGMKVNKNLIPTDVSDNEILQDADYNNLGWSNQNPSSVKYLGLIAYLIKAVQELNIQRQQEKDALQASHDGLQASHDSLQASHDSLQASNDSLKDELTQLKTLLQSKGIID